MATRTAPPLWSVVGGFFGPSDDAERRNRELRERWREFERERVGEKGGQYAHLRRQREAWLAYTGAWDSGDYDTALPMLQAIEADAEVIRSYVNEHRAKAASPTSATVAVPIERLQGGTLENASAAYRAGAAAQQGNYSAAAGELAQSAAQGATSSALDIGGGLVNGIVEAVRDNPLPSLAFLALLGLGAFLRGGRGRR